jgi:hypothetical protein
MVHFVRQRRLSSRKQTRTGREVLNEGNESIPADTCSRHPVVRECRNAWSNREMNAERQTVNGSGD